LRQEINTFLGVRHGDHLCCLDGDDLPLQHIAIILSTYEIYMGPETGQIGQPPMYAH
jgi:hypothetical protein